MDPVFKILIIDDNLDIHRDFKKILSDFDVSENGISDIAEFEKKIFPELSNKVPLPKFQIQTAEQGEEGVAMAAAALAEGAPFALAFIDMRMPPGIDGIETIRRIWQIDENMQTVICTAYSDYSWEETITELGLNDNLLIIKKPFDMVTIRQLACALTKKWLLTKASSIYTKSLEDSVLQRAKLMQYQATHDQLTGLYNRSALNEMLLELMSDSEKTKSMIAILFFDLDRFKPINDSLNHTAGDYVLKTIADRMQGVIKPTDILSRIGGDEFILVVNQVANRQDVIDIAKLLINVITQPIHVANHTLNITSSIGIALYPEHGSSIETLIQHADIAMYSAKDFGGNQYHFYTDEMNMESSKYLEIESELHSALVNNELFLVYQPQISVETNRIVGVEALVRWNHPNKGILQPADFVKIAEESGLIVSIGEWILKEACRQCRLWQDAGLPPIRMAVNITTPQLRHPDFCDMVADALAETEISAKYLEIEISENAVINNAKTIGVVYALKELGVYIAMDDFGTGYSSLNHIRNIPIDRIKIDKSYIENIMFNRSDEVIIQAIIDMAAGLNIEVLAEGVENIDQLQFLKDKKCGEIQGFYFSKAISPQEVEEFLIKDYGLATTNQS